MQGSPGGRLPLSPGGPARVGCCTGWTGSRIWSSGILPQSCWWDGTCLHTTPSRWSGDLTLSGERAGHTGQDRAGMGPSQAWVTPSRHPRWPLTSVPGGDNGFARPREHAALHLPAALPLVQGLARVALWPWGAGWAQLREGHSPGAPPAHPGLPLPSLFPSEVPSQFLSTSPTLR